jgi:ankyrin repeat protein
LENAREFLERQAVPLDERFNGANDYFEPPGQTGIHALYTRSGMREGFTYYPGKGRTPHVYVELKSTGVHFALSGDPSVDLAEAAKFGNTDLVKDILDEGVDVNIKTKYGSGALADATCNGQVEAVRLLLERGADVNQTSSSGWTALMCAIALGREVILDMLLSHWPDVNARTEEGLTALMLAVRKNSTGIVRELLARGADPFVEDVYGRTALGIAEKHHRVEIARLIKEAMSVSRG